MRHTVPRVTTTKFEHSFDTLASKLLNAMRVIVR
mgnify:CR=1 FL=1